MKRPARQFAYIETAAQTVKRHEFGADVACSFGLNDRSAKLFQGVSDELALLRGEAARIKFANGCSDDEEKCKALALSRSRRV